MDRESTAKNGLTYRILRENDQDAVVLFLQAHFIPFEPMSVAVGLEAEEENAFPYIVVKNSLWQGDSIGVFDNSSGGLCAVRVNMLSKNNDSLPEEDHDHLHSEKQQTVDRLLRTVKGTDLKHMIGTQNYMEHIFVAVAQAYTRRGIASELYKQSEILAKEHGCEKMIVICSNYFTSRSVEKAGYVLVKEIMYKEYTDDKTGKKAFEHMQAPHDRISLMVKTLEME